MKISITYLLAILVALGILALLLWGDKIEPGSVFAGLAAFIAAIKSKLFGRNLLKDPVRTIDATHELKREEWEREKRRNDVRYEILNMKLDSLDRVAEVLKEKLRDTQKQTPGRSEEEIREWLKGKP